MRAVVVAALFALLCLVQPASAFDSELAFQDPALQARYEDLTRLLRCPMCQNQAIADSPVGIAADLRRELREQIGAGRTDHEIMDFMTARYGDFILYNPPVSPRPGCCGLLRVLLLLIGLVSAAVVIARRSKGAMDDGATTRSSSEAGTV